ncbi:efflux system membrane fusion protein [Psychroflexus torquis ATCC 700755]|uniref:Efflux system membrane fusion protein n=1 Tax=Psychroflexus torquis (strain ATCC 700755 / CIP 106069 / ACAM 623) TaxID=313595 RepID=K4IEU3_PSYTT|nr:efflux RND transporter periplasmic adaptor subunit [Psychroflexus torquis]AFU69057.1 efflux system membrane fusion protein [Psychroflexus torquis ATCC 700755]
MNTKFKTYLIAGLVLVLGIFIGSSLFSSEENMEDHNHTAETESSVWTCSMHPQIRNGEPGDCPICGMDLIPANTLEETVDPDAIRMTKSARTLAKIETTLVSDGKNTSSTLELSGQLDINEKSKTSLTANFDGRIEQLNINFEGETVQNNQVVAELYSSTIQVLKDEYALAKRTDNESLMQSVVQKIENLELSLQDIQNKSKLATISLRAQQTGNVTQLMVAQGDQVKAGQALMEITDLSTLWAMFDVYEQDLNLIKVGDEMSMNIGGATVTGKVDFISPIFNTEERSAKVRVVVQNPNLRWKPGIFVTGVVSSDASNTKSETPLYVPKSSVLWTGKRSIVYKQLENENGVYFKLTTVDIGKTSGDTIEILSGLQVGDEVVTQGAFSIDSEAQLADKTSMMDPKTEISQPKFSVEEEKNLNPKAITQLLSDYRQLKVALASDNFEDAKTNYKKLVVSFSKLRLRKLQNTDKIRSIDELREEFLALSEDIIAIAKTSNPTDQLLYVQLCPMANNSKGASWLSFTKEIKNPYYGASMLTCGSTIDSIQ